MDAGVPVLVEKPFATSALEAKQISDAARSESDFTMETMWTRFLPTSLALNEKLTACDIGEIRTVSGNFGASKALESGYAYET